MLASRHEAPAPCRRVRMVLAKLDEERRDKARNGRHGAV